MQRKLLWSLFLSLLPLGVFFFATPAHATVAIVVNSHLDVISSIDNLCTLREAVIAVNTQVPSGAGGGECPGAPGLNTIVLSAGTYSLTIAGSGEDDSATGDLDLKRDMTIQGNGSGCALNPNCTSTFAIVADRNFDITSTVHVTITHLDIMHGNEGGFGGGGIRNFGKLTLNDVYLSNNTTAALGGGLYNETGASATLNYVGFVANHAGSNGGAVDNEGAITASNTLFFIDSTGLGRGGGLYNHGTAALSDVIFWAENASDDGGGIFNNGGGDLDLNRVDIHNNQSSNGRGGGIAASGRMTLTNVTLSANTSITTTGKGGAIFFDTAAAALLTNVTIYTNTSTSAGGIYREATAGTISLRNTIVAGNSGGNCSGVINSLGYNLENANTCAFAGIGDLPNTNPLLGPLQYNGGPNVLFLTHALLSGSPAINKIPFGTNGCGTSITTDQRGYARIAPCDIGAFEYALRVLMPLINR